LFNEGYAATRGERLFASGAAAFQAGNRDRDNLIPRMEGGQETDWETSWPFLTEDLA
jgi:hypothetical protein